jgi:hypothetical protein
MKKSIAQMDIEIKPSIKVNIQLSLEISLPGKTIDEVEVCFRKAFEEAACMSLGKYIEERDRMLVFEEMDKKEREIRKTYRNRHLKLSYGDVYFSCRQVKDKGGHFVPILRELNLPDKKQVVIGSYPDILTRCAFATFRKSQAGIRNPVSLGSLHNEFQMGVQSCRKDELEGIKYLAEMGYSAPEPESSVARVMDDGIFIRKRALSGRGKGEKQGKKHHMEIQMTRCDFYDKNGEGDGCWSYPPFVYASLESSKDHVKHGKTYLDIHSGLSRAESVIHISDAKANGKRHCREYNENAAWQLDWYHLGRHVRILNKIDEKWKKEVWELLEVERLDEAITCLSRGLDNMKNYAPPVHSGNNGDLENYGKKTAKWWNSRIKEVEDLVGYLKNNREGIYGVKKLVGKIPGEDLPFGSGPMERLCGILVAHRMKGQGKAWKPESASNMVWLISKEFQKLEENEALREAIKEALWWNELQEEPVCSSQKSKDANSTKISPAYVYPQSASFPIVENHKRSAPGYKTLKGIGQIQKIICEA